MVSASASIAGDAVSAIIAAVDGAACMSSRKMSISSKHRPIWWVAIERAGLNASGRNATNVRTYDAEVLRRGGRLNGWSRASHRSRDEAIHINNLIEASMARAGPVTKSITAAKYSSTVRTYFWRFLARRVRPGSLHGHPPGWAVLRENRHLSWKTCTLLHHPPR